MGIGARNKRQWDELFGVRSSGIIALTAMASSFNGAGLRLNTDRIHFKSFDECLMAPISLLSLLLGKAVIGVIRGLVSSFVFLAVAMLMAPRFQVGLFFLISLVLTCLTFAFLGVLVALLAETHDDMATISSLILLPMTFLEATFFLVNQVPAPLKIALYALPLTHSSTCLKAAALNQPFTWSSFILLIFFLLVFSLGSLVALKRVAFNLICD
jgi:ABC-2 type transport system permease protein